MSSAFPHEPEEPPRLRALRRLVSVLTATMILGILTVAATLVIRIAAEPASAPLTAAPEAIALPDGETILAVGAGREAVAVATRDAAGRERLRLFHPVTGTPLGVTELRRE